MSGIEAGIKACRAYAADESHGYELGYHSAAAMRTGTDCSGLVRLYAATVEGVSSVDGYPDFATRTERSVLTARGWTAHAFSLGNARRGDVLLSNSRGHTVVYLGDSRILGAEGDWDGRRGDSSGSEVCERGYYSYGYETILRPPASKAGAATKEVDELTDNDIKKIVRALASSDEIKSMVKHAVWEYNWGGTAADKARGNCYDRLAACYDACKSKGYGIWSYKNKDVNGDTDAYGLLTQVKKRLFGEE